jgi:hypothetical protein
MPHYGSYHIADMPRTDLYLKIVADHDEHDSPQQLAKEICRQVQTIYGVRSAELTNFVTRPIEE